MAFPDPYTPEEMVRILDNSLAVLGEAFNKKVAECVCGKGNPPTVEK